MISIKFNSQASSIPSDCAHGRIPLSYSVFRSHQTHYLALKVMNSVRIALLGAQHDYAQGLFPLIARSLGYSISWTKPADADLLIYGAFYKPNSKPYRWLPKPLRSTAVNLEQKLNSRKIKPLTLFHTCESLRHDVFKTDYSISFDLGVQNPNHLRLPYWMELVDWSHEGITGNTNPRYGELLSLQKMQASLGNAFLSRPQKAAMITSHLLEPRKMLFDAVDKSIGVQGFGSCFNHSIKNHHQSNFEKRALLQEFAFNLCPENHLFPGYYTEKIPESFLSGALPLGWVDANVCADFNPGAFINLEPMAWENFESLTGLLQSKKYLESFCDQSLLLKQPSLEPAKVFIGEILKKAAH